MPQFQRAIHLRFHFAGESTSSDETYDPKMYVRSNWTPPYWTIPPVVLQERLDNFSNNLNKLFKKRMGKTNLLSYQTRALQSLQRQQDFLICPCDKNLGPAIIERHNYIKIAMRDHLLDGRTYRRLSKTDCDNHKTRLTKEVHSWLKKYNKTLTKMERAFLKQGLDKNKKPFSGFYLTLKAHKLKPGQNVNQLKSRQSYPVPVAYYIHWVSGRIVNSRHLPNNKFPTFATATTSVKNHALQTTQQQLSSSPPTPSLCTRTSPPTQLSC